MKQCDECGRWSEDDERFCPECGTPLGYDFIEGGLSDFDPEEETEDLDDLDESLDEDLDE